MFTVDCYVPGAGDDADTMVSFDVNGSLWARCRATTTTCFRGGEHVRPREPAASTRSTPANPRAWS